MSYGEDAVQHVLMSKSGSAAPRPARVGTLTERIRRRIRDGGPITFSEYMHHALYDPEEGFYSGLPVGHFLTSPQTSPVFGALVAGQAVQMWEALGPPGSFRLIEVGAGDGTLARQILGELRDPAKEAFHYTAVETSSAARASMQTAGAVAHDLTVLTSIEEVSRGGEGLILANEFMDNLPFHWVRHRAGRVAELYVGLAGNRFALVEGAPSSPEVERLGSRLTPGSDGPVSPSTLRFVDWCSTVLERGYVLIFDYAAAARTDDVAHARRAGTVVHGYRRHAVEADVLRDPGSMDITAGVDFQMLAGHAASRGLSVWGPFSQREALIALGFREWESRARERQATYQRQRRGIESIRVYSARNRASLLVDPTGLGSFQVLCLGIGAVPSPRPAPSR